MVTAKKITGTKEWAEKNRNCLLGCPHRCRYCYARDYASRFHRIDSLDAWGTSYLRLKEKEVTQGRRKVAGTIMFPSSHDIVPEFLEPCMILLRKHLAAGNNMLIVTKPHMECVTAMCDAFGDYRDQILFRFTITAMDNEILSYWEPGAASFEERLACLKYAHDQGYRTSVSVEPMLDTPSAVPLYEALVPYVTDTIWFGKMKAPRKYADPRTAEDEAAVQRIIDNQADEKISRIYELLKDEPKVRWKDSIKRVVGLSLATKAGQDV